MQIILREISTIVNVIVRNILGYVYTLYGKLGDEEVTVTENGVESSLDPPLQLTATEYGTEGPKIIINFKNDNGNRDVFFHSNWATIIKGPISGIRASHSWNLWNPICGSLNENSRCGKVRNGVFAWNGTYEIKFDGMFRILSIYPSSNSELYFFFNESI